MKFQAKGKWKAMATPSINSSLFGGIEVLEDYNMHANIAPNKEGLVVKRKGDSSSSLAIPPKKRKNMFQEVDVNEGLAKEKGVKKPECITNKKKKKKRKKVDKNKPAINMTVLEKITQGEDTALERKHKMVEDVTNKGNPDKIDSLNGVEDSGEKLSNACDDVKTVESTKALEIDMSEWRNVFVCEDIIDALAEKGFNAPTPIQRLTLPSALRGNDYMHNIEMEYH